LWGRLVIVCVRSYLNDGRVLVALEDLGVGGRSFSIVAIKGGLN
jgi:hypothetical protein